MSSPGALQKTKRTPGGANKVARARKNRRSSKTAGAIPAYLQTKLADGASATQAKPGTPSLQFFTGKEQLEEQPVESATTPSIQTQAVSTAPDEEKAEGLPVASALSEQRQTSLPEETEEAEPEVQTSPLEGGVQSQPEREEEDALTTSIAPAIQRQVDATPEAEEEAALTAPVMEARQAPAGAISERAAEKIEPADETGAVEAEAGQGTAEAMVAAKPEATEEPAKTAEGKKTAETEAATTGAEPAAKAVIGAEAKPAEAAAATETETGAAGLGVETGGLEAAAAGGASMPVGAAGGEVAGGGGGAAGAAAGGEPQSGGEDEGAAELEERLAKADPERAVADEADPADVARGEPIEAEGEEAQTAPEIFALPEPGPETPLGSTPPEAAGDTNGQISATETSAQAAAAETATESAAERAAGTETEEGAAPESEAAPVTEEEPASAEGFTGDEPALGSGALERSPTVPELSEPEKQAAMDSLGESIGGGGEAGGGGGGGAAVPERTPPETPDVSAQEPSAALATVGSLPPMQLKQALGGVNTAVGKSAGDKRAELAASPPSMERPTGSPKNLHRQGPAGAGGRVAGEGAKTVEQAPEGRDKPTPEPEALPEPPPSPAEAISEPAVAGGEGGKLSESDVSRMSDSISSMPTKAPGLRATAGPAPKVDLSGNADPAQTDQQQARLEASVTQSQAQGRADVAREMGENTKIYPSVPPEQLTARVPQGGGQAPSAAAAGGAVGGADPEALSIIAQKEKGGEIQAAMAQAQGDLAAKKAEYGKKVGEEKAKSAEEIAALEAQSTADQAQARAEAQADVRAKKGEWSQEQEKTVREANKQADVEVAKGRKDIQQKKLEADSKTAEHIKKGNEEAEQERRKAEQKAAAEKHKGKKESKGFFGWLASKAKTFFNAIKTAVKAAFDLARKLIKKAIEAAKKAAMWAIEQARKAIVAAIKAVGKALIAIGDRLLAAFPKLRDRFRKFIQSKVDAAVKKVNEYAERLKKGVSALLDALAAGLDKLIGWLEKGMLAAIDAYAAVVDGAIKFAEKVAQAVGAFVSLIKDVAAGPIQWLKNLGAGVVDGIKNHLWKAFKEAVQEWFNSKLEQVLGLGTMVWGLIKSGGLSLAKVGKMAWEGIKAMIPPTLIRILVEKLAAMIVPAAGAVMVIIEGLQAAWGAVQRIIAAFQKFFAFLKSVKTGNAGPPFAAALAAAAIAVVDFVANWLIVKLAKGAAKIGGKIKALAKKILGRKKGRAVARKQKAKPKKPEERVRPKKPVRAPEAKKPAKKGADRKEERKKDRERKKQERLDRAVRAIDPKVTRMVRDGVSRRRLQASLIMWRLLYRLSVLRLTRSGQIEARINPRKVFNRARQKTPQELGSILRPVLDRAHEEYRKRFREDASERGQVSAAERRVESGGHFDSPTGRPLTRGQRGEVFSRAPIEPRRRGVDVGEGVTARQDPDFRKAVVGMPSTTLIDIPGGGHTWPQIQASLTAMRKSGRVRTRDIARFMGARRSEQAKLAADMRLSRGDTQLLQAATALTDLERGRRGAEGTAQLLSLRLGEAGSATLPEMTGDTRELRGGEGTSHRPEPRSTHPDEPSVRGTARGARAGMLAPVTMTEAQSEKKSKTSQLYRIGRIFQRLEQVALRAPILAGENAGQLHKLARAVDRLLRARSDRVRANAENVLVAELVKLLETFD